MKRIVSFLIILNFFSFLACGQQPIEKLDSLRHELSSASNDSTRIFLFILLSGGTRFSDAQASIAYSDSALSLAEKNNRKDIYAIILSLKGATLLEVGKIPESLAAQFESLRISEEVKDSTNIAIILNRIGNTYMELGDYPKAIEYYRHSKDYFVALGATAEYNELSNIGNVYELMGAADSAMYYQQITMDYVTSDDFIRNGYVTVPEVMFRMGNALKLNRDTIQALQYYKNGITEAYLDNDYRNLTMNNLLLARLYKDLDQRDSSLKYSRAAIEAGRATLFRKGIYESALLLSDLYSDVDSYDSAFAYLSIANTQKDSLIGMSRFRDLQRIILAEQEKQRETEALAIQEKNTIKQYTLLAGLGIFLVIAFLLYYNNRQKQKANVVLKETLSDLKSTQSQLIQSEKMASLGELTAGIAHEIQNPLNFVNNFSELNQELVAEAVEELEKGDIEEAKVILKDIGDNSGKINNHGKRADAIVKGMLQHSRASSAEKEPTDINKLADEYLRLAYHGLRAKDKSFNAELVTDFDESVGMLNVVPQDIGRVILNLITNAFYAVNEKAKSDIEGYQPTVTVSSKRTPLLGGAGGGPQVVKIAISDNGNGIPKQVLEKIFQPFFTTKPTGQGTGLGLSMSYDIVTKGHGGELTVENIEGGGTEFIIQLQIN